VRLVRLEPFACTARARTGVLPPQRRCPPLTHGLALGWSGSWGDLSLTDLYNRTVCRWVITYMMQLNPLIAPIPIAE